MVSTHSRLKAAGSDTAMISSETVSFNTQPPKGGWSRDEQDGNAQRRFNTQPPKGGWDMALGAI